MQASKANKRITSKLLTALLAVALVFTMMPLTGGASYAGSPTPTWNDNDLALTVNDGKSVKEYTRPQVKDLTSTEYTFNYMKNGVAKEDKVVGVALSTLLQDAKKKYVVKVETVDNSSKVKANGKTGKELVAEDAHYILAYTVNGEDAITTTKDDPPFIGCFMLYGINADGGVDIDKMVNRITVTNEEPVPADTSLTVTGAAVSAEKKWASLDELRDDSKVKAKTETKTFLWKNSYDSTGTAKVTGISLENLINIIGVKPNMEITSVSIDMTDGKHLEYTAKEVLTSDLEGNKAMFAWTYTSSDKGIEEKNQQRTILGQFKAGEVNQSRWGKYVNKLTINGKEKPPVVDGQEATVDGNSYTVTSASAKTAAFTKGKNGKKQSVPSTVTVNGVQLRVTEVAPNAFTGTTARTVTLGQTIEKLDAKAFAKSKVTKLVVKTKKLTKASVKGSLKSSKVKKIQVKVGSKKVNKKYVKKYKKFFTKKNAGKKARVYR
ncbi:MAG: hypothetical protein IJI20_01555 [Firmicutes bacterium]|nr:hypothetical protein [Bacillota bacterium]